MDSMDSVDRPPVGYSDGIYFDHGAPPGRRRPRRGLGGRMSRVLTPAAVAILTATLFTSITHAQSFGEIIGTISDSTGSVGEGLHLGLRFQVGDGSRRGADEYDRAARVQGQAGQGRGDRGVAAEVRERRGAAGESGSGAISWRFGVRCGDGFGAGPQQYPPRKHSLRTFKPHWKRGKKHQQGPPVVPPCIPSDVARPAPRSEALDPGQAVLTS